MLPRKFNSSCYPSSWAKLGPKRKSKRLPFVQLPGEYQSFAGDLPPLHVADGVFWGDVFLWLEVGISFKNKHRFVATLMDWKWFFIVL